MSCVVRVVLGGVLLGLLSAAPSADREAWGTIHGQPPRTNRVSTL